MPSGTGKKRVRWSVVLLVGLPLILFIWVLYFVSSTDTRTTQDVLAVTGVPADSDLIKTELSDVPEGGGRLYFFSHGTVPEVRDAWRRRLDDWEQTKGCDGIAPEEPCSLDFFQSPDTLIVSPLPAALSTMDDLVAGPGTVTRVEFVRAADLSGDLGEKQIAVQLAAMLLLAGLLISALVVMYRKPKARDQSRMTQPVDS